MLSNLTIKNVALIDYAEIDFTEGLNVLTGETGAGKSVIIDSLNFVLGAKSDKSMIKHGEKEAVVKAIFDLTPTSKVHEILNEYDVDDDAVLISRKLDINGKSELRVNGSPMTVSVLRKITAFLVDLHGQSEHYSLIKDSAQLSLIDNLSEDISPLKNDLTAVCKEYKNILKNLEDLGGDDSSRAIRTDVLTYQINEIKTACLKEGEEEELLALREKIKNQEKIVDGLNSSFQSVSGEGGAEDTVQNALSSLARLSRYGDEYQSLHDRLDSVLAEIEDISSTLNDLLSGFDFSEKDADRIEARLDVIKNLKKKYGKNYTEINDFLSKAETELEKLNSFDALAEKYLKQKAEYENILDGKYNVLHNLRVKTSKTFSDAVLKELKELGMKNASFEVAFKDSDKKNYGSPDGYDGVTFMFSANKGEPVKELSKIISGGELSRFMLAIKTQTAKAQDIGVFVFDEIDVGISGETAMIVAKKFADIAKNTQVIAISHLPQVSAMADNSVLIKKTEGETTTKTSVISLDYDGKVSEVARLAGGGINGNKAQELAKDLINYCDEYKKL